VILTFDQAAFKHRITKDEIRELLADPATEEFELTPSRVGNYRIMYVGFTLMGRLLEVGIECVDAPEDVFLHVYHAQPATTQYRELYDKAKGR